MSPLTVDKREFECSHQGRTFACVATQDPSQAGICDFIVEVKETNRPSPLADLFIFRVRFRMTSIGPRRYDVGNVTIMKEVFTGPDAGLQHFRNESHFLPTKQLAEKAFEHFMTFVTGWLFHYDKQVELQKQIDSEKEWAQVPKVATKIRGA
ncbi:hypothetical protein [Burkholderia phage BCSR5]|nr:hypothetical protein [Burkholderia phage BCSR5]